MHHRWQISPGVNDTGGKFGTGINDTGGGPNFATSFASVIDTGGKFATSVNDTSGNLPPVTTTPVANCLRCKRHRLQTMGTISDSWQLKLNLKEKMYLYANSTTQRCPREIMKIFDWRFLSICYWCQRHRWCTLSCEYLRKFSKKFETALMVESGAWWKRIHVENLKSKISWHYPFKRRMYRHLDLSGTVLRHADLSEDGSRDLFIRTSQRRAQGSPRHQDFTETVCPVIRNADLPEETYPVVIRASQEGCAVIWTYPKWAFNDIWTSSEFSPRIQNQIIQTFLFPSSGSANGVRTDRCGRKTRETSPSGSKARSF